MADRGIVPAEQIRAAVHNGGVLLLALHGDTPVGFCYGFVGLDDDEPVLCSHMLAVLPSWRSRGVGRALKLAQRDVARERGLPRITWTFDPLQARNAHLNLRLLGAHARRYHIDHYGAMDDDLNAGLPTDRLLAEWPVSTAAPDVPVGGGWILPCEGTTAHGHPTPGEYGGHAPNVDAPDVDAPDVDAPGTGGLIAVPHDIDAMRADEPELVTRWRLALRAALTSAFADGLVAVDLRRDAAPGVAAYVLGTPR